jgi:hypothetical protein
VITEIAANLAERLTEKLPGLMIFDREPVKYKFKPQNGCPPTIPLQEEPPMKSKVEALADEVCKILGRGVSPSAWYYRDKVLAAIRRHFPEPVKCSDIPFGFTPFGMMRKVVHGKPARRRKARKTK